MTGRPLLDKLCRLIETEWGGDDFIFDQVKNGVSIAKIAAGIELPGHGVISRGMIYDWKKRGGEDRAAAWREAMQVSGHSHAEDAGDVLEELVGTMPSAPEVNLARSRSSYKTWLAGRRNDEYAEKQAHLQVNLNVGELHLDALRKRGHMDAVRPVDPPPEIEAADYELLEKGEDDAEDL